MTCSKNFGRLLQASCLGLIGMLANAGCGGSETNKPDTGLPGDGGGGGAPVASLNLDRSAVNLGTLEVGATGVGTVTVTNVGRAASGPVVVTGSAGVTATGCTGALAANASCSITITATPATAGSFSGTVSISANPGAVTPMVVAVIATVNYAGLFTVSPGTIDLGNVAVGVAAPKQIITVTAKAAISDLVVSSSGASVSIDKIASTCTAILAANASCTVVVNFLAATSGAKSDSIVISGGGAAGKTVTVPVSANAQAPAKLVVSPSTPQSFVASVGLTSTITFGVANSGDVPTGTITATVAPAGSFTATSSCLILPALGGCTITVAYKPTAVTAVAEVATLTVTDTGVGASTVAVALSGQALLPSTLVITPATSDLGSVLLGATGPATIFTVTNTGDTASNAVAVTLSSTDFIITNDTCTGAALAAKTGACTIAIALKPATVGAKTATLTVSSAGGNPAAKTLTGAGITVASLSATPSALDFGSIRLGKTGTAQTVVVKNNGGSTSGALSFTKGGNFSVFPIASNTCTGPLAPAATCAFSVNFAPIAEGSQAASYTVTDGATSATIAVSGSGLAGAGLAIAPGPVVKECLAVSSCETWESTPLRAVSEGPCFEKTVLGGSSSTVPFVVTAASLPPGMTDTGAITVALVGTDAADFKIVTNGCTVPLLLGATCQVVVSFSPTAAGTRQASLTVTPANGGPANVTLQGVGKNLVEIVALNADVEEGLTGLDFGQIPVLASNVQPPVRNFMVVVRGPNTAAAHTSSVLTSLVDPTTPADFSYPGQNTNPCNTATNEAVLLDFGTATTEPSSPEPWDQCPGVFTCVFQVKFYPQTVKGARTATISATGSGGGTDTKTLTGEATGPLLFYPSPVNFASTFQVGGSTNAQTTSTIITLDSDNAVVTLFNYSLTAESGVISLALGGANADQFIIVGDRCSTTKLSADGGNCSVAIAFVPTSIGAKTATLTATAGTETATVIINAGATDAYLLTVTPGAVATAPYDFGTLPQTLGSDWVAFTVTNPAASPRSAQVGYDDDYGTDADDRFIIANGVNHARGTCGLSGSTSLAPGASCTILVQFKPKAGDSVTAVGDTGYQGSFYVWDDSKPGSYPTAYMTGKVSSMLTITPSAQAFPDMAAGAVSAASVLTIANRGSVDATLSITPNSSPELGPFSVDQGTGCTDAAAAGVLKAGETCALHVRFLGQQTPGSASNTLTVSAASGTAVATAKLTGNSVKAAKLIAVGYDNATTTKYSINMGGVRKGSRSGNVTLTFKNEGSVPTTAIHYQWEGLARDTADNEFFIVGEGTNGCVGKTALAAGATCTVTVYYEPSASATGSRGPIDFSLSADAGDAVNIFDFTGYALNQSNSAWIGTSTPTLGVYTFPTSTAIGLADAAAPVQVFQLANGTATAITVVSLTLTESFPQGGFELTTDGLPAGTVCQGNSLAPATTCTFAVRFQPTSYTDTTAYRHAFVTVAGLEGAIMSVVGKVKSPASLTITPETEDGEYAFGQVVLNQNATKAFTVTNTGETASAAAVTAAVSGTGYTVTSNCNAVLAAGASCTGTITLAPGGNTGDLAGILTASSAGMTSATVDLIGTGVLDTVLTLDVAVLTFGPQAVGVGEGALNYVTISNFSNARNSGVLTVALADKTNFEIVDNTCDLVDADDAPRGLNASEGCYVAVRFIPQTLGTGAFSTSLTFTASPGGTHTVTLNGTAISALKTDQPEPVVLNPSSLPTIDAPMTVNVWLEQGAPTTSYIRTSMGGTGFMIVEDRCAANKLQGGYSCQIMVAYVGGPAVTPLKTGTLTINGGTPGNSATVVFNSTTPPAAP